MIMMKFLLHVLSSVIGLFLTCGIWLGATWLYDMVTGHRDEDAEREEEEECEEEGRREVKDTVLGIVNEMLEGRPPCSYREDMDCEEMVAMYANRIAEAYKMELSEIVRFINKEGGAE